MYFPSSPITSAPCDGASTWACHIRSKTSCIENLVFPSCPLRVLSPRPQCLIFVLLSASWAGSTFPLPDLRSMHVCVYTHANSCMCTHRHAHAHAHTHAHARAHAHSHSHLSCTELAGNIQSHPHNMLLPPHLLLLLLMPRADTLTTLQSPKRRGNSTFGEKNQRPPGSVGDRSLFSFFWALRPRTLVPLRAHIPPFVTSFSSTNYLTYCYL